jgi:cysteine-rich repeat protein
MAVSARIAVALLPVLIAAGAAQGQSQGPNTPASVVNDASFGTLPWGLPGNAALSDNLYAGVTPLGSPTQYLKATGFGFTVPVGAIIDGVEVDVEHVSAANMIVDSRARIVRSGVIGASEHALGGTWPTMDAVVTYGSNSDLWEEVWTVADVNSAATGFALSATNGVDSAAVDSISMTVFYSLCGDSQVGLSEDCDDGNTLNGDCCSSTCQFEGSGSPCPDNDLCNGDETCDGAGTCEDGPPLDCDDSNICTQDSCDAQDGCLNATQPQGGCRTAQKGILVYKDNTNNAKDKLVYKWIKGAATTTAEFGLPTGTTAYTLCLYAGTTALGDATIPSGSNWLPISTKGFKYKDLSGTPEGITKAKLKSGAANKAKVQVKGKGGNLPDLPAMPFGNQVTAQLIGNNDICFESVFNAPYKKNADGKFKAKF